MKILTGLMMVMLVLAGIGSVPVAAQEDETAKIFIVRLNYLGETIRYREAVLTYGFPPDNAASRDLLIEVKGSQGKTLGTYGIGDPRILYYEDGAELRDNVDFGVIVPYQRGAEQLNVYNGRTRQLMVSVDLTPSINRFCQQYPKDPDCPSSAPVGVTQDITKPFRDFFNWIVSGFYPKRV